MAKTGYDPNQLDELLERVALTLEAGEACEELVLSTELGTARRGYDRPQVDAFLQRLAPAWRSHHEAVNDQPVSESRGLFGLFRRR